MKRRDVLIGLGGMAATPALAQVGAPAVAGLGVETEAPAAAAPGGAVGAVAPAGGVVAGAPI